MLRIVTLCHVGSHRQLRARIRVNAWLVGVESTWYLVSTAFHDNGVFAWHDLYLRHWVHCHRLVDDLILSGFPFYLFGCLVRNLADVLWDIEIICLIHQRPMKECFSQWVLLWFGQKQAHSEPELDIAHGVRVLTVEQLVDFVDGDDVRHVAHLVVVLGQVDVELVVVVVPQQFEHALIDSVLFHNGSHHVRVNELIHYLHWHVHSVVGRDVSLQLQEVPSHVIDVHK